MKQVGWFLIFLGVVIFGILGISALDHTSEQVRKVEQNLDNTEKNLDDVLEDLNETNKSLDRTEKYLDDIEKGIDEMDKEADKLEKGVCDLWDLYKLDKNDPWYLKTCGTEI